MIWLSGILVGIGAAWLAISLILYRKHKKSWLRLKFMGSHPRLKKLGAVVVLVFLVVLIPFLSINAITRLVYFRNVPGNARWATSNGQRYLQVTAPDRYSLGYLEGQHLAREILNVEFLLSIYIPKEYKALVPEYERFIPEEYKAEMQGMADGATYGSGIFVSYEDILFQNLFVELYYGRYLPRTTTPEASNQLKDASLQFGCTAFGVRNVDGTITVGQNFDFVNIVNTRGIARKGYLPALAFVSHTIEGHYGVFGLRLGGMLSLPMARTTVNLTVLCNYVACNIESPPTLPFTIGSRYALEVSNSCQDFLGAFFNYSQSASFNYIISDSTSIIGVQAIPTDYRVNTNETLVHTNRYVYEDWNDAFFTGGEYALTRQRNAQSLLAQNMENGGDLRESELLAILGDRTDRAGSDSRICRDGSALATGTVAFLTNSYFGLGNVHDGVGTIPL